MPDDTQDGTMGGDTQSNLHKVHECMKSDNNVQGLSGGLSGTGEQGGEGTEHRPARDRGKVAKDCGG